MQTGAIPQAGNPARGCHIVQERAVFAGALPGGCQADGEVQMEPKSSAGGLGKTR